MLEYEVGHWLTRFAQSTEEGAFVVSPNEKGGIHLGWPGRVCGCKYSVWAHYHHQKPRKALLAHYSTQTVRARHVACSPALGLMIDGGSITHHCFPEGRRASLGTEPAGEAFIQQLAWVSAPSPSAS